jgi:TolB-like protein/tetratricopeptide (TPR) repeat protein
MSAELEQESRLEIAHVLFMDIVGYSKLRIDAQSELLRKLNELVRSTEQVRTAEAEAKLVCLPAGDGMALAFFTSPDAPVRCALEIGKALKNHPDLPLRTGINSGPVDAISDVNDRSNVAGAGINMAQRVMDCGDAGHILLSQRVADDLAQYSRWEAHLYDLGELEVKHGVKVSVVNFYTEEAGNAELPEKLKRTREKHAEIESRAVIARRRKRLLSGALVLLLATAAAVAIWIYSRGTPSKLSPALAERSIAVLPFKPLIAENRDQVLEMGMADTLITKLSDSGEMIMPSLTSVRQYNGLDQDPLVAGRKLGVNSVLDGNVQKSGDRLRVTVRLIKVADGSALWSGTFDEKFTDVFSVQDKISQRVVEALALRLSTENQKRLTKRYTENVEAYQLYLTGRYYWSKLTPPDIAKSIGFFQQAIEIDPNYALAFQGLADAYSRRAVASDALSKDAFPPAKAAATKALEIDESLAEPHATLALIHMWFDWDWVSAEREGKRAIELNPNSGFAHLAYAHVLSNLGRHDEAIVHATRSRELDPVSLIVNAREGAVLFSARRYDEARERLQKTLELDPNFWVAHLFLGHVFLEQGKCAEAIAEFSKAKEFSRGNSQAISMIGCAWARAGEAVKARGVLEEMKALSAERYIPSSNIAALFLAVGERDEAIARLEKAFEERDVRLSFLKIDPKWDSFRSDPRFAAMLQRAGLQ